MKSTIDTPAITLNPATASGKNATNREELPLYDIKEPGDNDVLSGRGVTTNKHAGNVNFRSLVALNKELYVTSTKKQKMAISRSIVEAVRCMNPAGRFLDKDPVSGLWSDIGDRKAIEKTSQALRDGAATLRKQLSEDLGDPDFLTAVFEGDAASKSTTIRSDGSASGNSSNGDAKKPCKPRLMKSKLAKKGHRRAKSAPTATQHEPKADAPKKVVPKKAKMDQVVPFTPEKSSSVSAEKKAKSASSSRSHVRSASLDTTTVILPAPPKRSSRAPASPKHSIPEHEVPARVNSSSNHFPYHKPSPKPHPGSLWEKEPMVEPMGEGFGPVDPWAMGHSRNSSASSSTLPPFFPMSPIGRHARGPPQQQRIFSCFQDKNSRPPLSPMHRSWSPRDFHHEPSYQHNYRQSIGGATCFSEGDVDIPSLDRTFDRTFDRYGDGRVFALEEDMDIHMPPILGAHNDEQLNVSAPPHDMEDDSGKLESRGSSPSNKDGADLRYSPTTSLDCDFSEKSDLLGDVIMKDSDPPDGRVLSPLPFMEDDSDTCLLDNLSDLFQFQMPATSYSHYDKASK